MPPQPIKSIQPNNQNEMKTILASLLILAANLITASAHERMTVGPGDGRLAYLDSTTTPNAEFNVKDGKIHITLLDKDLKPIALADQILSITAGEKGAAKKLEVTQAGADFVAPLPDGADYWCIFQLKEKKDAKSITFRVHYLSEVCAECKKAEWRCDCGNKGSGKDVQIPADLKGLWAEINGHHGELEEALKGRDFAAIDEGVDALPLLVAALPGKSSEQAAAAKPLADAIVKDLQAIHDAGAARTLDTAKANAAAVAKSIADLKKLYPADVGNSKTK
jgi:hypothetical protein